jgi:U3 small nucleolar RNA-associated protein 14
MLFVYRRPLMPHPPAQKFFRSLKSHFSHLFIIGAEYLKIRYHCVRISLPHQTMPGRQSHGRAPSRTQKVRVRDKAKKRSLDAFAIASHQNPENIKIRQHRLGASEGGNRPGKRAREEDSEGRDEVHEISAKKQRKEPPAKDRFDELDLDLGSDSEGNEWKLGQVDSDDDSDLESEDAFGESDEERFEGFSFSGSSGKRNAKKQHPRTKDVNLNEDGQDEEIFDSESEEDDLGEDAIDLAEMLDATADDNEDAPDLNSDRGRARAHSTDESEGEASETAEYDSSSVSSADDEDHYETSDPSKLAALRNLITNLPQGSRSSRLPARQRSDGASEYNKPSDFGLISKTKLTLEDLGLPTIIDPLVKKSLKFVNSESQREGGRKGIPNRLEVPLAKRQQDRLDRSAAYEKSKETLGRWTDTVMHNRRADHLLFPLRDNDVAFAHENRQLQSTGNPKPFNELEATIQSILEESGLATSNGRDDEDHIQEVEKLESKKLSIEEEKARRDQLRMARDLLFREEAKSKRIKKIKSKSYRKVHRKQREKEEQQNKKALAEGGLIPSEDEFEAQDRRRAAERMGAKHRGSKWAKATKEIGRAAWDEDARVGITEMARRDEELRKRVDGRAVRKESGEFSEMSSDEDSENEFSESDDDKGPRRVLQQLDRIGDGGNISDSVPGSKLANMKFMRHAEAVRMKENDAMVEVIRLELAGKEAPNEEEVEEIGRRVFGPSYGKEQAISEPRREFQEPLDLNYDESSNELDVRGTDNGARGATSALPGRNLKASSRSIKWPPTNIASDPASEGGAWSKMAFKSGSISQTKAQRRQHGITNVVDVDELDLSNGAIVSSRPLVKETNKQSLMLDLTSSDEDSNAENGVRLPIAIRDQELIRRAFAGADVVGEFETEKKQTVEDEDEKIIDNTLPGWGSWTGDGLSKKEKARNKGRFLTKSEGVQEQNRKDAKLQRVIINEKRVKKVSKKACSNVARHKLRLYVEWEVPSCKSPASV